MSIAAEAKTDMRERYQYEFDDTDSDSDSSSCISLSNDWEEVAEDLWTYVQCLLDLDPLIKCPAPDFIHSSEDGLQDPEEWNPHVTFIDRISSRFPSADSSLVDRLARANWERFRLGAGRTLLDALNRQASGNDLTLNNLNNLSRPGRGSPDEGAGGVAGVLTAVDEDADGDEEAEVPKEFEYFTDEEEALVGEQAAVENVATAAQYTEPVSKVHDSGLETSIDSGSAYAETVMSYRQNGAGSVKIPPLPEEGRQGRPFECFACGDNLHITNNSAWKYVDASDPDLSTMNRVLT
ncbi:hypothetical protein IMZ48_32065 [Candidatus Bathyarchaeota archaeon]|nr:hypothetical protein [Candidatus Bathyarchaeota archaeon]